MKSRGKNRKHARCEEGAEAFIFDLDGVITDTAQAHADAWKKTFDAFLEALSERREKDFGRFDRDKDYRQYVDGKPRYDGVRSFLASRGIELETGSPDDPPELETVFGLGNRKNELYQEHLDRGDVKVYPEAPGFVRRLKSKNIKTAVVSSSKNCKRVLEAAGIGARHLPQGRRGAEGCPGASGGGGGCHLRGSSRPTRRIRLRRRRRPNGIGPQTDRARSRSCGAGTHRPRPGRRAAAPKHD
ncbi:MAG: HAD hydrolase-like protein [Desulfobacterales bacterium]